MYFENQCNAPADFMQALEKAWEDSNTIAAQELGLTSSLKLPVYIVATDPNPDKPDPQFSVEKVAEQIKDLENQIKHLEHFDAKGEIIEKVNLLWLLLIGEIKPDGPISPSLLIHEITTLLEESHNGFIEVDLSEIIIRWKKVVALFHLIEYPMIRAGFFSPSDNSITICYETIRKSNSSRFTAQYGAMVLAHEFFHAFHYKSIQNSRGKKNWSSSSRPAFIRRRAVKESLAEYFGEAYARRYLDKAIWWAGRSVAMSHPFPNWGYAGTELIEKYELDPNLEPFSLLNPFFKAVFFSSVLDMEQGYQLLKKEFVATGQALKMDIWVPINSPIVQKSLGLAQGVLTVTESFYSSWNFGNSPSPKEHEYPVFEGQTIKVKDDFNVKVISLSKNKVSYSLSSLQFPVKDPGIPKETGYYKAQDVGYPSTGGYSFTVEFSPFN